MQKDKLLTYEKLHGFHMVPFVVLLVEVCGRLQDSLCFEQKGDH